MYTLRWLPLIGLVVVAVAAVLVFLLPAAAPPIASGPNSSVGGLPLPSGSSEGPTPTPAPTPGPPLASYAGPPYDPNIVTAPTVSSAQSKLWFHDGAWWAVLVSSTTAQLQIHELNWDTQLWVDTGVLVDARAFARSDVLWDGERLYVAGAGNRNASDHALRVSRFTYDAAARRWVLDPDFPVSITDDGTRPVTLARAQDGQIWLAFVANLRVYVTRSANGGVSWLAPFVLPVDEARAVADQAALVTRGTDVAVVWTNQREEALHVAFHADGAADDAWSVASTPLEGLTYADDHLSVRAAGSGSIYAVVRTSFDEAPNRNPDAPQVVLARLDPDGAWSQALVSRVRDGHRGPSVLLDDERERVYVLATSGGDLWLKDAGYDELAFVSGLGTPLIDSPAVPIVPSGPSGPPASAPAVPGATPEPIFPGVGDASSTKQAVNAIGEMVVVTSDDVSGRYQHAVVGLPGGRTPPSAQGHLAPAPPELAGGLAPGTTTFLFRDSFSAFAAGPATRTGWEATGAPPGQTVLDVAEPAAGDPALRLIPDSAGAGTRACKPIAPSAAGIVIAQVTVRQAGIPDDHMVATMLRGPGGELANVRFHESGFLRYFQGAEQVVTGVPWQPGVWYVSRVTANLDTQTYSWEIGVLDGGPLLVVSGQQFRDPVESVDELCLEAPNQLPGAGVEMFVDDVSVERGPGG